MNQSKGFTLHGKSRLSPVSVPNTSISGTQKADVYLHPELGSDFGVEAPLVSHTLDWLVDDCTRASTVIRWG